MSDDPFDLDAALDSYVKALQVIGDWLNELGIPREAAPSLVARLAQHSPPILLGYPDEFKD